MSYILYIQSIMYMTYTDRNVHTVQYVYTNLKKYILIIMS